MDDATQNKIVFDLETQYSFDEVGGRGNLRLLKVSVLGAYDYQTNEFRCYEERELSEFEERLRQKPHLIGFNIRQFDLPVLAPYLHIVDWRALPILDLMEEVVRFTGHRVSLNSLAAATLDERKIADGLEALRFWREGRMQELKEYCLDDVRLTRELYEYGLREGHVLFASNFGFEASAVPVRWAASAELSRSGGAIRAVIEQARAEQKIVEIDYVSTGLLRKKRRLNVYGLNGNYVEGFCHLRQDVRNFRIDRILGATLTEERYQIPQRTA